MRKWLSRLPFTRPARAAADRREKLFLSVREDDLPDPEERAMYEAVLNSAMRDGESTGVREEDGGVTVNGVRYESAEAARDAVKSREGGV